MKKRLVCILLAVALLLALAPALGGDAAAESISLSGVEETAPGAAELPARYDLRELGLVTGAKNQGKYGTCWAFAAASAMESNALVRGCGEYDISEYQLCYAQTHILDFEGDTAAGEGPENSLWYWGVYGATISSTLLRGYGLRSEEEYPYSMMPEELPKEGVSTDGILFPDSCYTVPATNTRAIKELIMKNGAVVLPVCATSWTERGTANTETWALYHPQYRKYPDTDHDIALVGWDDGYSRDNFSTAPPGDGAWIIKNSWGTEDGEEGFFYLSYYDAAFNQNNCVMSMTVRNERSWDRIYQYDGGTGLMLAGKATDVVINFTAAENESVTGVRIKPTGDLDYRYYYTYDWSFDSTDATICVFRGVFDPETPDAAEPVYTQKYRVEYPDYQTVDFDAAVPLRKGENYYVRVSFDRPVFYALDGKDGHFGYQNTAGAEPGETYLKMENTQGEGEWKDCVEVISAYYPSSACIKVLTRNRTPAFGENARVFVEEKIGIPAACAIAGGAALICVFAAVLNARKKRGKKTEQ